METAGWLEIATDSYVISGPGIFLATDSDNNVIVLTAPITLTRTVRDE